MKDKYELKIKLLEVIFICKRVKYRRYMRKIKMKFKW